VDPDQDAVVGDDGRLDLGDLQQVGPGVSLRTAFNSTQFKLNGGYWSVMSVNA
jgi:hypothetical protein